VYAWLLRGLPSDLVGEYGVDARSDFERAVNRANARAGWMGVIGALVPAALDVLRRIPVEHWRAQRERRAPRTTGAGRAGGRAGGDIVGDFSNEVWQAARSLVRRPGYVAAAVLTLGLGIGANMAIFTVVNTVLLRPLSYPESERIVQIRHRAPGLGLPELNNSPGLIELYRGEGTTLQSVTATHVHDANLSGGGVQPARVRVVEADVEFFDVFATRPALGRAFAPMDVTRDAAPVAILMYDAWQSRFGGDAGVVGSRIELNGESTEVIGVMPEGFAYPDPKTVALVPGWLNTEQGFGAFGIRGLARIRDDAALESVRAELNVLQGRIPELWTDLTPGFLEGAGWSVSVDRLRDLTVEDIERALWVLFGTVGLVLLIAGANVANLFLVRAESRQREVAIRSALGANRRRLASTFISESLLLGLGGGIVGAGLAWSGVQLLVATGPTGLPRLHEIGIDATALVFGAALSVIAGVALGMMPLLGRRIDSMAATLREGGRTATAGRSRHRTRNALIVSQVAMALVLLAASGLMLRSVLRLAAVDPGVEPEGVLTVGVAWGDTGDLTAASLFYDAVLEEIAAIPGVESAGAINALPLAPVGLNGGSFDIESRPRPDDAIPPTAMYSLVMPGFFETVGIDVLEGRYPERRDHTGGQPVVWISQTFAREHFPDGAIGERIQFNDTTWNEIAGVVSDVRTFGLREDVGRMAYLPISTTTTADRDLMHFAVQTRGDAAALLPAIRNAVARIDAGVPLTAARTMTEVISSSMAQMSFTVVLLAIAAAVALLLGAVGLYGVISWVVAQRTHEMGVRIALGARPADVHSMVVRQGIAVTVAGIAVGLAAALAATRFMASLLYEIPARDPVTFTLVPLMLLAVSLAAAWMPARRAAAADPLASLRVDT
jgi:predicted permease